MMVKNLHPMRETCVRSLGWEDPLEKGRLPTLVFRPGEFHGLYSPWGRNFSKVETSFELLASLNAYTSDSVDWFSC